MQKSLHQCIDFCREHKWDVSTQYVYVLCFNHDRSCVGDFVYVRLRLAVCCVKVCIQRSSAYDKLAYDGARVMINCLSKFEPHSFDLLNVGLFLRLSLDHSFHLSLCRFVDCSSSV